MRQSDLTLLELRAAWVLLAVLLLVVFWVPPAFWPSVLAIPWMVGLLVLARRTTAGAIATATTALARAPGTRIAMASLGGLLILSAHLFSVSAALFLFTWAAAGYMLLAGFVSPARVKETCLGVATGALTLLVVLLIAEAILRSAPIAERFGLGTERISWAERYDGLWQRNVLGLRSRHESVVRTPGVHRVLAIGDSFTWGDYIADSDSTWPALLEAALERRFPAEQFEVINMGRRAFTTANEAELLHRLGWQFDPDIVVVQFYVNDALPSGPNFQQEGEGWLFRFPHHLLPVRFRSGPVKTIAVQQFLEQRIFALQAGPTPYLLFRTLYDDEADGWGQLQAALREIGEAARARGTPVVLMLYPYLAPGSWTAESHPLREIHEKVAEQARRSGLRILDLTPVLAAETGDWRRWWATPYDPHPNPQAHRLAVAALLEELTDIGWPEGAAALR